MKLVVQMLSGVLKHKRHQHEILKREEVNNFGSISPVETIAYVVKCYRNEPTLLVISRSCRIHQILASFDFQCLQDNMVGFMCKRQHKKIEKNMVGDEVFEYLKAINFCGHKFQRNKFSHFTGQKTTNFAESIFPIGSYIINFGELKSK